MAKNFFIFLSYIYQACTKWQKGFPSGSLIKNSPAKQEMWVQSLGWKDTLEKKMQPTPVFLPEKFQGQRNLTGYSPWGSQRVGHHSVTKQQMADTAPSGENTVLNKVSNVPCGSRGKTIKYTT